ncbi:MAG: DUF5693 family protein [Peptoanaerobacter stomatis]|uniref:DUF5693 family protein n=1 Tax=Peptoanaerobacter stomatis TaxID=796937 RepID=UPI003FA00ABB
MRLKKIYFAYLFLMFICLLGSLKVVYERINVESNYKTYETVMELRDIKSIASVENRDYLDVAREFTDIGVNSICVFEDTIDSLKLNENFKISTRYDGLDLEINGTKYGLEYIKKGLEETVKDGRKIYYKDEDTLIIEGRLSDFAYNSSQIMRDFTGKRVALENNKQSLIEYTGLGFVDSELQELKDNKFSINLRPVYIGAIQDEKKSIDRYINFIKKYSPNQRIVIFGGEEILGGEENTDYLAEKMKEASLIPVAIETSEQDGNIDLKGLRALTQKMDYQTTRLFSTLTYIQDRYDYGIAGHNQGQEIMNSYYRAISERNIRVIYFRAFHYKGGPLITDMSIYKQRFEELNSRLDKFYGITPITSDNYVKTMDRFLTSKYMKLLATVAIMVSALIIFDNIFKNTQNIQLVLLVLGVIGSAGIYKFNIKLATFNTFMALFGTISFATLSIVYLLRATKKFEENKSLENTNIYKLFLFGTVELLKCIMISLIGVTFIVTLYGDSVYMLEFSKFSGVKISQMLPLLIVPFAYLSIIGLGKYFDKNRSLKEQVVETLQKNVKVWQVVLLFAMLGVLGLMLLRSGHTSNVDPSSSEILMRNIFEYIFPARPRNKAIFLGYPSLILLIMLASKKKFRDTYILFALAATIGQADILNTFSHIRTPFLVSLSRVGIEYAVSFVITFVIVVFIDIICKIIQRGKRANA